MPIKTANEIFRDYETDGVPSSGAHKPIKPDIRQWGTAVEAGFLATPRIITVAGAVTIADNDFFIVVNLAAPGTVAFTFGPIANRGAAALVVIDHAKTAAATMTFTPNGAEEIGGRTGAAAWTVTSGGVGMGGSAKFYPSTTLNGWVVGI